MPVSFRALRNHQSVADVAPGSGTAGQQYRKGVVGKRRLEGLEVRVAQARQGDAAGAHVPRLHVCTRRDRLRAVAFLAGHAARVQSLEGEVQLRRAREGSEPVPGDNRPGMTISKRGADDVPATPRICNVAELCIGLFTPN